MTRALAKHEEVTIPKNIFDAFESWYADEQLSSTIEEGDEGQAGLGGDLVFFKAKTAIKHARTKKQTKTQTIVKSKVELVALFNDLIGRIRRKTKKRVVFVR